MTDVINTYIVQVN